MTGLTLENVSHAFDGHQVIRDVSLAVASGELACLFGPSGCGKTTLLRIAAGLETLQRGRIAIGGSLVAEAGRGSDVPPERRGVGLMFQDYALFPHLTVFQNITFGLVDATRERLEWVRAAMLRIGIADIAEAYPHTLSGGQQQRVALLRAVAPEPRVLLLDEPFSGLDVTRRAQVRERARVLLKDSGVATLMVTHDPEEAMFMADLILVMGDGRIVQAGTPVETYFQPVNAFVAALFGGVNRLDGRVEDGAVRTLLGAFPAPGLAEGTPAQVLIRPEGLGLSLVEGDGPHAQTPTDAPGGLVVVRSARLLGRTSHLRVCCDPGGAEVHLQARIPGVFLPEFGTELALRIDRRQAFVFPAE